MAFRTASTIFSAEQTASALPYPQLAQCIADVLCDNSVQVPPRIVQALPSGGSLFVMPAVDAQVAITKLITFLADNPERGLPAIQGDVVVIDPRTGQRLCMLHGPTVTARRTAAVSLLAAQRLAPQTQGPLLVVGAGVQGHAHVTAFAQGLGVREVWVASRSAASANALVAHAHSMGLRAQRCDDADAALHHCPLVVTCTSAQGIAMRGLPRPDAFVCAVGAFTPKMVEWAPEVCQHIAQHGQVVVDTRDADHEAGDLLQAGLDVGRFATLGDVVRKNAAHPMQRASGPVFFKSCGWAGWDLAAARCALANASTA
jgi:1-piperideine-2-carboxylate/1-pyrroline-2-carboxylate reductase [NAD(P)H]